MKTFLKRFFLTVIFIFLCIVGIIYFILEYAINPCVNEIVDSKLISSSLKAVLFIRGCGATTKNSYHLSFIKNGESIDDRSIGNISVFEGNKQTISFNDGLLIVHSSYEGKFFKQKKSKNVEYQQLE
tara:strand:+ start:1023 stop:1403 length:381 start_codon:yes stop_codon:yes gene_type:complete